MATIKGQVDVIINATPRLQADISGNDWPPHSHADHTGLAADDHTHYMTNVAGPTRHHTGDVYFDEKIMSSSDLQFDDNYRYIHTDGGGDWDQDHIKLSGGPGQWQDLYDAAGGIVSIIEGITLGITAGGGGGGVTLDGAYDFGGAGAGRSISANAGAVEIGVPDASNNAVLKLLQNDVTNNKDCLDLYHKGTGNLIYIHGTSSDYKIYADGVMSLMTAGNLNLNGGSNITFVDGHQSIMWGGVPMPFSDNDTEWLVAWGLLGNKPGSLLGLIKAAAGYSGALQDLQSVYDEDPSVTIGAGGPIALSIGGNDAYDGISISKADGTGASKLLYIENDDAESYGLYFDGDYNTIYGEAGLDIEVNGVTGTLTITTDSNCLFDVSSVFRVDVGAKGLFRIQHDGVTPDIVFSDNYIYDNWTQQYVALLDDGAEALQYVSDFGEVSIFNALSQLAAASGSVSEPSKQIVYGTGSGVDSSSTFTFDVTYDEMFIYNTYSTTYWYDSHSSSILLSATATQGNVIKAYGDLVIGSLDSVADNDLYVVARNSSTYDAQLFLDSYSDSGMSRTWVRSNINTFLMLSTNDGVNADEILLETAYGESAAYLNIIRTSGTSYDYKLQNSGGDIDIDASNVDFNDSPIFGLQNAAWGTPTTPGFTSNTLTVNFSTGKDLQLREVSADVDNLSITAPANGSAKGLLVKVVNTDTSSHTIGGGTGWSGLDWPDDGTDLSSETITLAAGAGGGAHGGYVLLLFVYDGSVWSCSTIGYNN